MTDVFLGYYEPKTFTADEDVKAGHAVKITGEKLVKKTTAITDHVAGICLFNADSGKIVTVVHGCWVKNVSGTLAHGSLEPSTTAGQFQAYTSGNLAAYCAATGDGGEVFVY